MGGESISGHHILKNSVAFANKAKGIDSNSCPDIQIENCTSFDNESYNVALYTNTATDTDFQAVGVLSFRRSGGPADHFKFAGAQDETQVYGPSNFYFDGEASVNSLGEKAQEDWFASLDLEAFLQNSAAWKEDRAFDMGSFLELTDKAPADTGARAE